MPRWDVSRVFFAIHEIMSITTSQFVPASEETEMMLRCEGFSKLRPCAQLKPVSGVVNDKFGH